MEAFLITGTDTGVGKTFIAYNLALALKEKGYDVGCFKPVETGVSDKPEDGSLLASATGQDLEEVVPFRAKSPLAPYSAILEGELSLKKEMILEQFSKITGKYEYILVEGAGGIAVPILKNYTYADLAKDLSLGLIIVARAGLGTINHTFLTVEFARSKGLKIAGLVLNGFEGMDPSEKTNPRVIYEMTGLKPLCIRKYDSFNIPQEERSALLNLVGL